MPPPGGRPECYRQLAECFRTGWLALPIVHSEVSTMYLALHEELDLQHRTEVAIELLYRIEEMEARLADLAIEEAGLEAGIFELSREQAELLNGEADAR